MLKIALKIMGHARSILAGKYAGQRIMVLGFLFGAAGAVTALIGGFLQEIPNKSPLIYLTAKTLLFSGWGVMILGVLVMAFGILIIWWKLFSTEKD